MVCGFIDMAFSSDGHQTMGRGWERGARTRITPIKASFTVPVYLVLYGFNS